MKARRLAVAVVLLLAGYSCVLPAAAHADTVGAAIAMNGQPRQMAFTPDGSRLLVATTANSVDVIDPATRSVSATISGFGGPVGIAVDRTGRYAYVGNDGGHSISKIDLATSAVLRVFALPVTNPTANPIDVVLSPDGTRAYATLYYGGIAVVDTTNGYVSTIPTTGGPRNAAITPDGTRLLVAQNNNGSLLVVDAQTLAVVATVVGLNGPWDVTVNALGTFAYVTNDGGNTVSVVDLQTLSIVSTITGFSGPREIVLNAAGTTAYVANTNGTTVSSVDLATGAISPLGTFVRPYTLAISPSGDTVWVGEEDDRRVTPITIAPTTPGVPTVVAGDSGVTVTVTPPVTGTGGPPDAYTVSGTPGGGSCVIAVPATSCTIAGLVNGTGYTFTVVASNRGGVSSPSGASATVYPVAPGAPATVDPGAPAAEASVRVLPPTGMAPGADRVAALAIAATALGFFLLLSRRRIRARPTP